MYSRLIKVLTIHTSSLNNEAHSNQQLRIKLSPLTLSTHQPDHGLRVIASIFSTCVESIVRINCFGWGESQHMRIGESKRIRGKNRKVDLVDNEQGVQPSINRETGRLSVPAPQRLGYVKQAFLFGLFSIYFNSTHWINSLQLGLIKSLFKSKAQLI